MGKYKLNELECDSDFLWEFIDLIVFECNNFGQIELIIAASEQRESPFDNDGHEAFEKLGLRLEDTAFNEDSQDEQVSVRKRRDVGVFEKLGANTQKGQLLLGRSEILEVGDGQVRVLVEWMIELFFEDLIEFEFELWFQHRNKSDNVLVLHLMIIWSKIWRIVIVKLLIGSGR